MRNAHFARLGALAAAVMKLGVGMGAMASAGGLIVALLVSSCSSAGDLLGGLTGGDGATPAGASVPIDKGDIDRLEIAAEQLQCMPQAVAEVIVAERDAWKAKAGDASTTAELRLMRIEALEAERDEALAERDAAIERLETIQAALRVPQEDTE